MRGSDRGAIGGAVVAFFLPAVDLVGGQPLYAPPLLGSVVFGGADPTAVIGVRMDTAAYYTIVHLPHNRPDSRGGLT